MAGEGALNNDSAISSSNGLDVEDETLKSSDWDDDDDDDEDSSDGPAKIRGEENKDDVFLEFTTHQIQQAQMEKKDRRHSKSENTDDSAGNNADAIEDEVELDGFSSDDTDEATLEATQEATDGSFNDGNANATGNDHPGSHENGPDGFDADRQAEIAKSLQNRRESAQPGNTNINTGNSGGATRDENTESDDCQSGDIEEAALMALLADATRNQHYKSGDYESDDRDENTQMMPWGSCKGGNDRMGKGIPAQGRRKGVLQPPAPPPGTLHNPQGGYRFVSGDEWDSADQLREAIGKTEPQQRKGEGEIKGWPRVIARYPCPWMYLDTLNGNFLALSNVSPRRKGQRKRFGRNMIV